MKILVATTVIVRIFSLVLFIYLLGQIPSAYTSLELTEYAWFPWLTTIPFLIVALLFWLLPITVAKILLPDYLHETDLGTFDPQSIEQASLTIIGLWLVIWSIPDGFNNFFALLMRPEGSPGRTDALGYLITTLIELGLGIWLVLHSEGIHRLIQRLRS